MVPHKQCQKSVVVPDSSYLKAFIFLLAIGHGETCHYSLDQFSPECQLCTFHGKEFIPASFPTSMQFPPLL